MHSDLKKLPEPNQLAQRLQRILPRFAQIRWVAQIESTNPELIQQARAPNGRILKPWLLGAHYQTQGRGRAGRHWDNQPGTQLMFSCAFDVFLPSHQLPTLSPLLGIAACQGLRTLLPNHLQEKLSLKWPNDVMWGHAKLAGILTEVTRASASRISKDHYIVVVGIGINLQKAEHLSQLFNRPVADWSQISQNVPPVSTHGPEHLVEGLRHQS